MDLSIIIVNYHSQDKLANCLRSISEADLSGISFEVVVVENNSGDQLAAMVNRLPFARLIVSNKNLGMGRGNNLGVKYSTGEMILISNPDIVFKPQAIKTLIAEFKKNSEIGLIGPKLLNPDGTLQYSCARFPRWYMPILRRTFFGKIFKKALKDYSMHDLIINKIWQLIGFLALAFWLIAKTSKIKNYLMNAFLCILKILICAAGFGKTKKRFGIVLMLKFFMIISAKVPVKIFLLIVFYVFISNLGGNIF